MIILESRYSIVRNLLVTFDFARHNFPIFVEQCNMQIAELFHKGSTPEPLYIIPCTQNKIKNRNQKSENFLYKEIIAFTICFIYIGLCLVQLNPMSTSDNTMLTVDVSRMGSTVASALFYRGRGLRSSDINKAIQHFRSLTWLHAVTWTPCKIKV